MHLTKLVLVFVALVGEMYCFKMMIIPTDTDGLAQLENSAIQLITTCYTNYDKTIVILGDFSGNFIKKLSSYEYSLALLDSWRRAENNGRFWLDYLKDEWKERNINGKLKVHIVVIMATGHEQITEMLMTFIKSPYYNREVYFLILGRSSKNNDAGCSRSDIVILLFAANRFQFLNVNLMCRDRTNGIVLYSLNQFINRAPEPWRLVMSRKLRNQENVLLSYFARKYFENDEMCNNLYFEKTHDLGGSTIETTMLSYPGLNCSEKLDVSRIKNPMWLEEKKISDFIFTFISYVNATRKYVWFKTERGLRPPLTTNGFVIVGWPLIGLSGHMTHTQVHGRVCVSLVSQFRGNKSQLHKIFSVIDIYSWVGNCIVGFITLIIFKYLLRQQLIIGLINVCRLICNSGITAEPSDVPARIYLGCLLFFVITMQGIFTGNLAALLTHDIPVRQVDTIKDLADLGYTVYTPWAFLNHFKDPAFKDRTIVPLQQGQCINNVESDRLAACLVWTACYKFGAMKSNLYASSNCIISGYVVTMLPWHWHLEEKFRTFLGILIGGNILLDFEAFVYEVRYRESEAEEIPVDPEIMTLGDFSFAFVIYGIGFGCAIITFIAEMMIYRYHHRVRTPRVIVLS